MQAITENETLNETLYCSNEVLEVDPKLIKIGWRARKDYGDITELAKSIQSVGQLQPVVVRKNKNGAYVIVAGLRRTRACRRLKIKVKAVVVSPENEWHMLSMQLAENVKRKDFDKLELGEGLQRLKTIYEKVNPESKVGATGGRGKKKKNEVTGKKKRTLAKKFVTGAADVLSISESLVYELLQIAELPDEDKKQIEASKTTRERNINARKAVSKVRKLEKEKRLKKLAAKRKEAKKRESERSKTDVIEITESTESAEAPPGKVNVIKIVQGDCMQIMPNLDPTIDLVFTDPPYGRRRSTIHRNESVPINELIGWDILDIKWVWLAAKTLSDGGSLISFCPLEAIGDYERAIVQAGLIYKTAIVWHKSNPGTPYRNTYLSSCEALVWGVKGKDYYLDLPSATGHNFVEGGICSGEERLDHETQKPLWLIRHFLKSHGYEGCNVLDPFCGVGTTLVVCKELSMNAIGIELEQKYVDKANLRLEAV